MSQELPHAPNMEYLRKQAKDLIRLHHAHDPNIAELLQSVHPAFAGLTPDQLFLQDVQLCDAQLVTARRHGFASWSQMKAFIELRPERVDGGIAISDTPGLTLEEALNERAHRQGMPPLGSRMTNHYGIQWQIVDYQFVRTAPSLTRTVREEPDRDPCDFLPVVVPLNPSPQLDDFFNEIDRCTSKRLVLVDTMPDVHPLRAGKNIHYVNGGSDPTTAVLHLDIARLHETVLAHELGHLWVAFVEGAEDWRFLHNRSDASKVNQFDFIQSFVLDLRVNDLIEERGFDMAPINKDQFEGLAATAEALLRGHRPPTKREAAVHAPLIAAAILEQKRWPESISQSLPSILEVFEVCLPEIYTLAGQFIASVRRHGYSSREGIRQIVDECATLSFHMTGDDFDLDRDLQTAPVAACMQDKHPQEFAGLPVQWKIEIGKAKARHRIGRNAICRLVISPSGNAQVEFQEATGHRIGLIELNAPMLPIHALDRLPLQRRLPHEYGIPQRVGVNHCPGLSPVPLQSNPIVHPPHPQPSRPVIQSQQPRNLNPILPMELPTPFLPTTPSRPHPIGGNSIVAPGQLFSGFPRDQEAFSSVVPNYQPAIAAPVSFPPLWQPRSSQPSTPEPGVKRRYMAGVGQWLGQARLTEQLDGIKLYIYGANNPVMYIDPSGESEWTPPWLGPSGPNRTKILNCLSAAVKSTPSCKKTGKSPAQLYAIMRCIMGCENSDEPGKSNPWNTDWDPSKPGKHIPLPPSKAGLGPCRIHGPSHTDLTPLFPNWNNQLCQNIQLGVAILCQGGTLNLNQWNTYSRLAERKRCYTPCMEAMGY